MDAVSQLCERRPTNRTLKLDYNSSIVDYIKEVWMVYLWVWVTKVVQCYMCIVVSS